MNKKNTLPGVIILFALGLTSIALAKTSSPASTAPKKTQAKMVEISKAWARKPLVKGGVAAGYLHIKNVSDKAFRLMGGQAVGVKRVELHIHIHDDHIMRMRKVEDGVLLPPGKEIVFKPGGLHIMLIGTDAAQWTDGKIQIKFEFDNGTYLNAPLSLKKSLQGGVTKDHGQYRGHQGHGGK